MMDHEESQGLEPDLETITARLESERPVPSPAFRGDLRRHLTAPRVRGRLSRRGALGVAAAYAGSGFTLLAIAALGVAGAGPFAA